MTDTWLIVGLGNPGPEYSGNRHNVGQMVLDELAGRIGGNFKAHKARAQVLEGRLGIGGPRVVLAKPSTLHERLRRPRVRPGEVLRRRAVPGGGGPRRDRHSL